MILPWCFLKVSAEVLVFCGFFFFPFKCSFSLSAYNVLSAKVPRNRTWYKFFVAVVGLAVGVQSPTITHVFTLFQSQKWELYTVKSTWLLPGFHFLYILKRLPIATSPFHDIKGISQRISRECTDNAITTRLMFLNVLLLTKSPQKPEMLICFSFANWVLPAVYILLLL